MFHNLFLNAWFFFLVQFCFENMTIFVLFHFYSILPWKSDYGNMKYTLNEICLYEICLSDPKEFFAIWNAIIKTVFCISWTKKSLNCAKLFSGIIYVLFDLYSIFLFCIMNGHLVNVIVKSLNTKQITFDIKLKHFANYFMFYFNILSCV